MLIKNKIKQFVFTFLARLGLKLGVSPVIIVKYFRRETIIAQLNFLFFNKKFPVIEKTKKPLDIIFLSYLGAFQGNNIIQVTIAKVLKERGHRIRFVLCDVELPICETTDISNHHRRSDACAERYNHLKLFFKNTDFEVIWLTDLISKNEIAKLKKKIQDSNKWNTYVQSMLLRYFKVGILDETHELVNELRNRAKHAALLSEELGNRIADLKPDRVFFSHGTYTTRGPAKDVMNARNIPLVSISRAKMAESQKFNWKTSGDWWDVDNEWENIKNESLESVQRELISTYLLSRRNHDKDIIVYNFSPEEGRKETLVKLNLDSNKKTYTLFTNVLWDAASAQRELVFNNPIDWTIETINWFRYNPEKQLIIRIHPAEAIIGTNQPMEKIIMDRVDDIPENVTVVSPKDSVNSWSLLKVTDVGLVHTSTVGLELALEGIPCVCVAKTHYRGKGFTIDTNNKSEYFRFLKGEKLINFDPNFIKELSLKYAYILFMKYQFPMPFYNPESHISINSFKSNNWDKIADHISIKQIIRSTENMTQYILEDEDVFKVH